MVWAFISLSMIHPTLQQKCPMYCVCETQGTKTDSYNVKAECTDIPTALLPTLKSLKVTKNMDKITGMMLEGAQHLSTLDFSGCNISFINNATFVKQAHLINLQLSHNKLTMLQPGTFQSMSSLRMLYLDYNLLKEICEGLFVGLVNLEVLSLTYNQLHSLPGQIPPLLELNVSFNEIGPYIGQDNSQLLFQGETLDLYGNPIHTVVNWNWIDTTKIKKLRIALSTIEIHENIIFNKLSSLTIRGDGGSSLDENTVQLLKRMTNMDTLILENFVVSSLNFFDSITQLKSLKLKEIYHTNSTQMREEISCLRQLYSLDLEGSQQLAEIFLKYSRGVKFINLEYISFRNCAIKNITTNNLLWYNGHGTIDLQDNPLDCTCTQNNWITYNLKMIQNAEQTLCDLPKDMKNRSVISICKDEKNYLNNQIKINDTNSNDRTSKHHVESNDSKTGIILFQIALVALATLIISLCIICLYIHHTKFQLYGMVTEQPPVRLQEIQHKEDEGEVEGTQQPTKC